MRTWRAEGLWADKNDCHPYSGNLANNTFREAVLSGLPPGAQKGLKTVVGLRHINNNRARHSEKEEQGEEEDGRHVRFHASIANNWDKRIAPLTTPMWPKLGSHHSNTSSRIPSRLCPHQANPCYNNRDDQRTSGRGWNWGSDYIRWTHTEGPLACDLGGITLYHPTNPALRCGDIFLGPEGVAAGVDLTQEQPSWFQLEPESVPHVSLLVSADHQPKQLGPMICHEFLRVTTKDLLGTFRAALERYSPQLLKLYRARKGAFGQELEDLLGKLDKQVDLLLQ
ncbi:unnamed protein product [Boreogadus saida]